MNNNVPSFRRCQWLETEGLENRKPNRRGEISDFISLFMCAENGSSFSLFWIVTWILLLLSSYYRKQTYSSRWENDFYYLQVFFSPHFEPYASVCIDCIRCLSCVFSACREKELAKVTIKKEDVELIVSFTLSHSGITHL